MHQLIAVLFLFSLNAQAAIPEVNQVYKSYQGQKAQFYNAQTSKKNVREKLETYLKNLNASLDKIKSIEAKTKPIELTEEGNQLALDLELIEPIQNIVTSNYTKSACEQAELLNELNTGNQKNEYQMVHSIIKSICK